jgi:hypothetical protein
MLRTAIKIVLVGVLAGSMAYSAEENTQTFSGFYRWDAQDLSGDLKAVFTPTGETTWKVTFDFKFQGPHTYVGTAEGSLRSGTLEGTVLNERETRSFDFSGKIKKGKFRGVHFESTGGARRKTGTLSMNLTD